MRATGDALARLPARRVVAVAPCDWDHESFCTVDGYVREPWTPWEQWCFPDHGWCQYQWVPTSNDLRVGVMVHDIGTSAQSLARAQAEGTA